MIARARIRPYLAVGVGRASTAVAVAGARIGSAAATAEAAEIVANYARGWVLFGLPDTRLAALEWRRFPRRAVITRETARVPRRLRQMQSRAEVEIRFDEDFDAIVAHCSTGRSGWLTSAAVDGYRRVHELGYISTVGVYRDDRLVAGLWGISVGRTLGLMSTFHLEDSAGSLALAALVDDVRASGRWAILDCGEPKQHARMYGAEEVPVERFSELVWIHASTPPPVPADTEGPCSPPK